MVSSFPQKDEIPNYRDVYLAVPETLKSEFNKTDLPVLKRNKSFSFTFQQFLRRQFPRMVPI